jgi:hypothetical protein
MKPQPFAYASDVTLTAVDSGTGEFYVSVDRLYGNEVNKYTMLSVQARFPANPPAETIKSPGPLAERSELLRADQSVEDRPL